MIKIIDFLKVELKKENYKKIGNKWVKNNNETYFYIELQKSQWSDSYYINVEIKYPGFLDSSWNPKKPQDGGTSFRGRLGNFVKENLKFISGSGTIESILDENTANKILGFIFEFFEKNSNLEKFKKNYLLEYHKMKFPVGIIPELRKYCEE